MRGNVLNWLGMVKDEQRAFKDLIRNYTIFLVVATIYTLICMHLKRERYGERICCLEHYTF